MKKWFSKLKWNSYSKENIIVLELDEYCDFIFDNKIEIRISTGMMAYTNSLYPYEMNIKYPNGNSRNVSFLNKSKIIVKMEELNNLKLEI